MKNIIKDKRLLLTIAVAILIVIIAGFLTLANSSKPSKPATIEPTSTAPSQQEKAPGTETEKSVDKAAIKEPAVLAPEEEKTVLEETGAEKSE